MIRLLNEVGDRMLAKLLPGITAQAEVCRGTVTACTASGCCYYCYRYSDGRRSTRYVSCQGGPCRVTCSDCC